MDTNKKVITSGTLTVNGKPLEVKLTTIRPDIIPLDTWRIAVRAISETLLVEGPRDQVIWAQDPKHGAQPTDGEFHSEPPPSMVMRGDIAGAGTRRNVAVLAKKPESVDPYDWADYIWGVGRFMDIEGEGIKWCSRGCYTTDSEIEDDYCEFEDDYCEFEEDDESVPATVQVG